MNSPGNWDATELRAAKKSAKALSLEFVAKLATARAELMSAQEERFVLAVVHSALGDHLDRYVARHRHLVAATLEAWWDKYAVTLKALESQGDSSRSRLKGFLGALGYD